MHSTTMDPCPDLGHSKITKSASHACSLACERVQKFLIFCPFPLMRGCCCLRTRPRRDNLRTTEMRGRCLPRQDHPGGNAQILQANATAVIAASLNRLRRNGRPVG